MAKLTNIPYDDLGNSHQTVRAAPLEENRLQLSSKNSGVVTNDKASGITNQQISYRNLLVEYTGSQ
jgi:hypothetical protein